MVYSRSDPPDSPGRRTTEGSPVWVIKELVWSCSSGVPDEQVANRLSEIADELDVMRGRLGELSDTIRAALPQPQGPQCLTGDQMRVCSDLAGDLGAQLLSLLTEAYLTPLLREPATSARLLQDRLTHLLTTHSGGL